MLFRSTARGRLLNGVDANTSAIFEYQNGAQAILNTNLIVKSETCATISGSKGRIEITGEFYRPTSMRVVYQDGSVKEFKNEYRGHGLREQAIYFEKMLIGNKKESDLLPLSESLSIMQTMDEIRNQIGLRYPFED